MLALRCSMPDNPKETQWRTQVTVPIGETKYSVGKQLAGTGFNFLKIEGASDSSRPEDTIFLFAQDSTTLQCDRELFNLDSTHMKETLGAIKIQNSTPVQALMNLHFSGRLEADYSIPFFDTNAQTIKNVYHVLFDGDCPLLPVTVTSTCAGATIDSLTVWIADNGAEVTEGFIDSLPPGQPAVVLMPVAGKSLDSSIVIGLRGIIRSSGNGVTITAGEGIDIRISLDGMMIGHAVIMDSLLDFSHYYEEAVGLSDTFNIDYIDFDTSIVDYSIRTTAPITLHVTGEMLHAWNIAFCKEKNLTQRSMVAAQTAASDSADPHRYCGRISFDTLGRPGEPEQHGRFKFGPARLFAQWDTSSDRSQVDYRFAVTIIPAGRKVTLDKNDRFEADLEPVRFPFVSLNGKFQYAVKQTGDPIAFATSFPWKKSIIDSLRHKLEFISASAPVEIRLNVSDSTRIDSTLLHIAISDPGSPSAAPYMSNFAIGDLANKNVRTFNIDFTDVINLFPDSLIFSCSSLFPAGSRLFLTNERDPETGDYRNNLKLCANVNFGVRIPLDWKLRDTAIVILEDSKVDLDSSLNKFDILDDMQISLVVRIDNRTNLMGVLYAIAATDADGEALLALREDQVGPEICAADAGKYFINLLGNHGLVIPNRDSGISLSCPGDSCDTSKNDGDASPKTSVMTLDPSSIAKILSAHEVHIRWKLALPMKNCDVMKNGDSFTVASSFRIKGTMNTRSLIHIVKR
jgi:hypothetical protein